MKVIAEDSMWFEVKAVYPKVTESGEVKMSKDVFAVATGTFGNAEKKTMDELSQYIAEGSDDVAIIVSVAIAPYCSLLYCGEDDAKEHYFRAKVKVMFVDEKTDKEKCNNCIFLVNASDLDEARDIVKEYMSGSMEEYKIAGLVETPIVDTIR